MGIQLPAVLDPYLAVHGIYWPEGDETACWDYGSQWVGMGSTLQNFAESARSIADRLAAENSGQGVESFVKEFAHDVQSGIPPVAGAASMGYTLVGGAMYIMGAAILAFKIAAIIELVSQMIAELQAIATSAVTFGASLAEIPIIRMIAKAALDYLEGLAIDQIIQG